MQPEERFDRIERQLEFLADHQGHVLSQIDKLSRVVDKHSEQISQLGDFLLRTAKAVEDLAHRSEEGFRRLAEGQQRLTEAQQRTDERLQDLTDRLNVLVNVVERYFSNGKKPS